MYKSGLGWGGKESVFCEFYEREYFTQYSMRVCRTLSGGKQRFLWAVLNDDHVFLSNHNDAFLLPKTLSSVFSGICVPPTPTPTKLEYSYF